MSPELLDPQKFNVDPRPTKESDRFALGMVIYEVCVLKTNASCEALTREKVLCGHVPYDGWDGERVIDAILKGIRPYKPKAAARLGLVDELWEILQRCWDERCDARPDLQVIRARLHEVAPMWHVRQDLPSVSADDATSLHPSSRYTSSSSPPLPSPSPSPAPPSPSPSPAPYIHSPSPTPPLTRLHNYSQLSTTRYATLSLRPSQSQPQFSPDRASSSRNPR